MSKGSDIRDRAFEFAVRIIERVDVLVTRGMSATTIVRKSRARA